jgi:predicted Ser/Thr protein kinase
MNAEQWNAAKGLLVNAAALPADQRAAFLEQQCPDTTVRAELLAMLAKPAPLSDVLAPPVLAAGTVLGGYIIESLLGAGGMGQVYRARDTRLARDIAIKILPADVAQDPDRLQRFEREAQLLAAVNHPHIASVYGLDDADGVRFLVMELIDGPSLADHLQKTQLRVSEALRIAADIAEGVQAAHHAGITHRDLKPANVMLSNAGAKLVDFGLAKASRGTFTLLQLGTTPGAIAGTLPYMSPEQMDGRPTDPRTDIFAFGCVLYEMLTGKPPFMRSTLAFAADVVEHEPPNLAFERDVPFPLQHVVERCLAYDPDDRWQTVTDLLAELRWIAETSFLNGFAPNHAPGLSRRVVPLAGALAGVVLGAVGLLSIQRMVRPVAGGQVVQSEISSAPAEDMSSAVEPWEPPGGAHRAFDWTPDGQSLVFIGRRGRVRQVFVRPLSEAAAHPLSGTEGAITVALSPDGSSIAFTTDDSVMTVPLTGGPAMELASPAYPPMGLAWGGGGRLFFTGNGATIWEVSRELQQGPDDARQRRAVPHSVVHVAGQSNPALYRPAACVYLRR